ncbi:hypothetical protein OS493_039322, partial [Desmophyllum pertusum]
VRNVALEIFPTDAAVKLKVYAVKYSWYCAKLLRRGQRTEADADRSEAENHFASFRDKCEGLLSEKSYEDIKLMLLYAGWHAANTRKSEQCRLRHSRKGYEFDASNHKRKVEEHYKTVLNKGEISETLARNVREMGWGAAWFAANTIFGRDKEADQQKANLDSH